MHLPAGARDRNEGAEAGAAQLVVGEVVRNLMRLGAFAAPHTLVRLARGGARRAIGGVSVLGRAAIVLLDRMKGRPDYRRWTDPKSLETWWDSRTQKLATFVTAGSCVLEFGAGRRQLERFLPSDCTYIPSDLVDRGPSTIVCDLNKRPLPDLRGLSVDLVVFAGVLEYIEDIDSLAVWLAEQTQSVVASYDCVKSPNRSLRRVVELLRRSNFGYMSHFTLAELTAAFERAGFRSVKTDTWNDQRVLLFELGSSERA